jgi:hypothetical protein
VRIVRSAPSQNGQFVAIPNTTIRDERLSYCARGILAELLSRPADWQATADELWQDGRTYRPGGEGRRTITAAFAELVSAGYLHRVRRQREDGVWTTKLFLFDKAISAEDAPAAIDSASSHRPTGNGKSVPPAQTRIPAGRTDIPLTDSR